MYFKLNTSSFYTAMTDISDRGGGGWGGRGFQEASSNGVVPLVSLCSTCQREKV
jgi:hypothetical protein